MSLFGRVFGSDMQASRDAFSGMEFISGRSAAGKTVNTKSAKTVAVVRDCLQVLHQSIAGLSFAVFEKTGDGKQKQPDHPIAKLLENPNREETAFEFIATMVDDLATGGDFYADISGLAGGLSGEIWRMPPDQVTVERLPDHDRRYKFRDERGIERILLAEDVWHIRVPPIIDGLNGTSAILEGKEVIGAALAIQDYSSSFFKNDATPPLVLKMEKHFGDEDSKKNFLAAFKKWATGANKHNPVILEHGIEAQQLSIAPEQAQFIETRKEVDVAITRLWHIPPHKVGILDRATFSNIEQQSLEFVIDTLRPWLILIENSIQKFLMPMPERFVFEFNVASLLRGDLKARYEAYAIGRQNGFISVNEIRRLENLNGIGADGDRFMEPLNMAPVNNGGA